MKFAQDCRLECLQSMFALGFRAKRRFLLEMSVVSNEPSSVCYLTTNQVL